MGRPRSSGYLMDGDKSLRIITINVSRLQLKMIEELISAGIFVSRSEGMRMMLNEWLPAKLEEFYKMRRFVDTNEHEEEEGYIRIPNPDGTFTRKEIVRRLE